MPHSPDPRREESSTYFVADRSNQDELNRLRVLDRMFTTGMGGALPEQPDPTVFSHVLDVGCGTGGWLIELAQTTPTCKLLVGVDASHLFIDYARTQAEAAQVANRMEFHTGDALRMLEFSTNFFDLVNHRSAVSWLRVWDWPKLLSEYQRVTRSGGVIRVTENDMPSQSNSPALTRLLKLALSAFYNAGHFFSPDEYGATCKLAELFSQHGVQHVQTRDYLLEYHAGTVECRYFTENLALAFRTMRPFLEKWIRVPDDYQTLYQQMLHETQQPGFTATVHLQTVWGTSPSKIHDPF